MNDEILDTGTPFRMARPKVVGDGQAPMEAKRGPGRPRKVEEEIDVVVMDSPLVTLRTIAQLLKQYDDIALRREIIKTLSDLLE